MVKPINIVNLHIEVDTGILYADVGLSDLLAVGFVISSGILIDGALVHGSLVELGEDDHPQYILVDGTRDFTANISTLAALPTAPSHLTRKDYVDNAVSSGTAGVSFLNSLQGIITISGAGEVSVFEIGQTVVVSGTPHPISNALIGSDGITVISGVSVDTIQGFRTEFVAASGSLQTQIDNIDPSTTLQDAYDNGDGTIVTVSGKPVQIGELVAASGTFSESLTVSGVPVNIGGAGGAIGGRIKFIEPDAFIEKTFQHNLNEEHVTVTIYDFVGNCLTLGADSICASGVNHTTVVNDPACSGIYVFSLGEGLTGETGPAGPPGTSTVEPAIVGVDGITVISGADTTTISGFQAEFTSASGSLQLQLDTTISGINDVFALRLDEVSATITYVGEADPGSAEASNVWRIKQLEDLAPDLNITWASGTAGFEFAWTDRLVLTYA